jgi:hypothetical protein
MWEIPFYLIVAPIITVAITLISTLKYQKYVIAPLLIFVILNIPTVILPFVNNVGWGALFGWACVYTGLSLIISLIVWLTRRKSPNMTVV